MYYLGTTTNIYLFNKKIVDKIKIITSEFPQKFDLYRHFSARTNFLCTTTKISLFSKKRSDKIWSSDFPYKFCLYRNLWAWINAFGITNKINLLTLKKLKKIENPLKYYAKKCINKCIQMNSKSYFVWIQLISG